MIQKSFPTTLCTTLLLLLIAGCSTTTDIRPANALAPVMDKNFFRKVEEYSHYTMLVNQLPGLAVSIIKDKKVVFSKGFGVADIRTGKAVTSKTVFQLGSDSKMMVGIAYMQLLAEGKIELDAPVTRYLPYFKLDDPRYKNITLREILSQRSGMPYCAVNEDCDSLDYQSPQYDAGALERHVRKAANVKLIGEPGKNMQYSDLGFEILGDVIAKVSGESFEDYIQHHIFTPLQMTHTSFLLRNISPDMLAAPHVLDPELKVNSYFPYSRQHAPSSHLFSTLDDMNRFALAQLNRGELDGVRILPAESYLTMWSPEIDTALPSPWEKKLGLGWFLGGPEGHRMVGHAGGDKGFSCEVIMLPDEGTAVIVMVNREYPLEDFAYQILQWMLGLQ